MSLSNFSLGTAFLSAAHHFAKSFAFCPCVRGFLLAEGPPPAAPPAGGASTLRFFRFVSSPSSAFTLVLSRAHSASSCSYVGLFPPAAAAA